LQICKQKRLTTTTETVVKEPDNADSVDTTNEVSGASVCTMCSTSANNRLDSQLRILMYQLSTAYSVLLVKQTCCFFVAVIFVLLVAAKSLVRKTILCTT